MGIKIGKLKIRKRSPRKRDWPGRERESERESERASERERTLRVFCSDFCLFLLLCLITSRMKGFLDSHTKGFIVKFAIFPFCLKVSSFEGEREERKRKEEKKKKRRRRRRERRESWRSRGV